MTIPAWVFHSCHDATNMCGSLRRWHSGRRQVSWRSPNTRDSHVRRFSQLRSHFVIFIYIMKPLFYFFVLIEKNDIINNEKKISSFRALKIIILSNLGTLLIVLHIYVLHCRVIKYNIISWTNRTSILRYKNVHKINLIKFIFDLDISICKHMNLNL